MNNIRNLNIIEYFIIILLINSLLNINFYTYLILYNILNMKYTNSTIIYILYIQYNVQSTLLIVIDLIIVIKISKIQCLFVH